MGPNIFLPAILSIKISCPSMDRMATLSCMAIMMKTKRDPTKICLSLSKIASIAARSREMKLKNKRKTNLISYKRSSS